MYRREFTDASQFIRYLRVHCLARGYRFYVTGIIPMHKDPRKTDEKIIRQYGIDVSKFTRQRRRKKGAAVLQYLRFGRSFIILATCGEHPFFAAERKSLRDVRRHPLRIFGDIRVRGWPQLP